MAKLNVKMYKCVKLTVHIYTTDCKACKIYKKSKLFVNNGICIVLNVLAQINWTDYGP